MCHFTAIPFPEVKGARLTKSHGETAMDSSRRYTTWKVDGATLMYWFIMAP